MIALIHSPSAIEAAARLREQIGARRHEIAQPGEDGSEEAQAIGFAIQQRESGKVRTLAACRRIVYPITSEAIAAEVGIHRRVASEYLHRLQKVDLIVHVASIKHGGLKPTKVYRATIK